MKAKRIVSIIMLMSSMFYAYDFESAAVDMEIVSCAGGTNAVTIRTTGGKFELTSSGITMFRRIDPNTNEYDDVNVATLSWGVDMRPYSIGPNDTNSAVVNGSYAEFTFNADSLFFIEAISTFSYTHISTIANATWNKGKDLDANLDRMWTDGYGGSLHANVNDGASCSSSSINSTTISMTNGDIMAHMVFPPRFYDFDNLYGSSARPLVHFTTNTYIDDLNDANALDDYIENDFGVIMLWADTYDPDPNYSTDYCRPKLLDSNVMGYEFKNPNEIRDFIDNCAHPQGFKVISYMLFPASSKWNGQDVDVSLIWMKQFQEDYHLDGWYLDCADVGTFMDDYSYVRQIRADIGDTNIIYLHGAVDAWAYNLGYENRYCGLKAVFQSAYADYFLGGETGDIASVESPNDLYYRFFSCDYGLGQAYGAHKLKTETTYAVSEAENDRIMGQCYNGAQRTNTFNWRPTFLTHFKPAYDARKAEYNDPNGGFDPDVDWPASWFKEIDDVEVTNVTANSATIVWTTDANADSELVYTKDDFWWPPGGPDNIVSDETMIINHNLTLLNLLPNTTYTIKIRSQEDQNIPEQTVWGHIGTTFTTSMGPQPYWKNPLDWSDPCTVIMFNFEEYVSGFYDRIYGANSIEPNAYTLVFRDTNQTDINDESPIPSTFGNHLDVNAVDRWGGYNRTTTELEVDTRRGPMTIEGYIYVNSYPNVSGYTSKRYNLFMECSDGHPFWVTYELDGRLRFGHKQLDGFKYAYSDANIPLGEWHHISITRTYETTGDPNNFDYEVNFYINGEFDSNTAWTGKDYADTASVHKLYIGGNGGSTIPPLDGSIDEVRLSNSIKSSGGQSPYYGSDPCTVALIHFDQYASGWDDRVIVESTDDADKYLLAFYDTDQANLDDIDGVSTSDAFGKYMEINPTDVNAGDNSTTAELYYDTRYGPMTIEGWIKPTAYPASGAHCPIFMETASGYPFFIAMLSSGKIFFRHQQLDASEYILSSTKAPVNSWTHIAATRTCEETDDPNFFNYEMRLYINGELDAIETWTGEDYDPNDGNNVFYIGGGWVDANGNPSEIVLPFEGCIDEVRLSNTLRQQN